MKCAWMVLVAIGCGSAKAPVESRQPPPPPPASQTAFDPPPPTLRLPRHFVPTRYTAQLAVDPTKNELAGQIAIDGTLDRKTRTIWLNGKHLTVAKAIATDGKREITLAVTAKDDLLGLRADQPLDEGAWTLKLVYRGQIEHNGFDGAFVTSYAGEPYLTTQFEATAARLVFPCLDEPDRKAVWQLTLDVPKGLVAVSNTPETGRVGIDSGHERVAFEATRPLPTYLVAFAVGPFEIMPVGKTAAGGALRVITPRGTAPKLAMLAEEMPRFVAFLESWFAIPFPYPKLDIVVAPSLRGGAMENAGMIITDARIVMIDHPSALARWGIVSVLGHETAHQWFGDLVTAAWWDDIWLNESFATWIEDKILAAADPKWPLEALANRASAFYADRLESARKIRQPIETEGDIHNAFDPITYPKGAFVLRMLEHELGPDVFRASIQTYLRAHADGSATAADLFAALDQGANKPLGKLVTAWFDQAGIPEVAMDLTCDGGGKARLALAQKRYLPSGADNDQTWTVPVCIAYEGAKHERVEQCTTLAHADGEMELPVCPNWFAPAGATGYYQAKLDAPAIGELVAKGWAKLTVDERLTLYQDVLEYTRRGRLPLALYWQLTDKLAHGEPREVMAATGDIAGSSPGMAGGLEVFIPADLLPAARAKVRAELEPLTKKYGLAGKPGDDVVTQRLRLDLVLSIVWSRSHVLDKEAKALAAKYHTLPDSEMAPVLDLAVNADPKLADKLRADLASEKSPVVHQTLLEALASQHDPKLHRAMTEALVPTLSPEDLARYWLFGDEDARADNEAYLRLHLDEVMKRLPTSENEDFPLVLLLARPFTNACDPARRDELAAYVTQHFGSLPSGQRPIKQGIEDMDICIASKKALEPSLRLWLGGKSR